MRGKQGFRSIRDYADGVRVSRKHFVLLAAALRLQREQARIELSTDNKLALVDDLIRTVAVVCASCNKEFSFDRFYSAANYKGIDNDTTGNDKRTATGNGRA